MKQLFCLIFLLSSFQSAIAQSSDDFLKQGIDKHTAKDYKGAIKDYNKAIDKDPQNYTAWYDRGTAYLAMNEFEDALKNFNKTIELKPEFVKAWYSRATVYVTTQKPEMALNDLNKVIELDNKFPNALTLRGQIKAGMNDVKGACADFDMAIENGDVNGKKYKNKFCDIKKEELKVFWPEAENWTASTPQENEKIALTEFVRAGETTDNWTEFGSITKYKNVTNVPPDQIMTLMFESARKNSPKAKLTLIEKNDQAANPYIIFKIESPSFNNSKQPESQVWYAVSGKQNLFTVFWAIKEKVITEKDAAKWIGVFKKSVIESN